MSRMKVADWVDPKVWKKTYPLAVPAITASLLVTIKVLGC
jgi:hypothetical protein